MFESFGFSVTHIDVESGVVTEITTIEEAEAIIAETEGEGS